MFARYTDEAKRAVFFAHFEAVHRGEEKIGAGDLLLGLILARESRAKRIAPLAKYNLELRAALGVPHRPITAIPYLTKKDIPLDVDGKKALAYALREADDDWQFWLDTDHLLRGLLSFSNPASEALERHGVSLDSLRSGSKIDRMEHKAKHRPWWAVPAILTSRFPWLVKAGAILIFLLLFKLLEGPY